MYYKWGKSDSVNGGTNMTDEVNGALTSMTMKPKTYHLTDSKESEDSLACDEDFLGWYKDMRPGQMTDLVFLQQRVFLKTEEEKLQLEGCIDLIKTKYERELAESHAEVIALRQENEQLRTGLLKAQTEVTDIQTELDKLKQEFMAEMAARSPLDQSISPPESVFMGLQSNCTMSTRSCEIVPGGLMPTQRRMLCVKSSLSGMSDSESVLEALSLDDVGESDWEGPPESDYSTTVLQAALERFGAESPCVSSTMQCQRKPPTGSPIQSKGRLLLCEQHKGGPMYRLVLAGDVGSGKSSFLLRLSEHKFRADMRSTVGVDCKTKHMLVDGKRMALQIWDTAGQERFHSISRSYFRKAHGILLLYDITSKESFSNITQWLEQIDACTDTPVPMCLVGNKADLRKDALDEQCVSWACGMRLATACGALFLETSAKDGTNVVEAVLHLAREVKKVRGALTDSTLQLSSLGDRDPAAGRCCWALT